MKELAAAVIDRARLTSLEAVIERGKATFIEVGHALMEIRDGRGYRLDGYPTFAAYCAKRWGWSDRHGRRLIEAARFADELEVANESGPTGPARVPETEYEARSMMRERRNGSGAEPHPTLASEAIEIPEDMAPLVGMPTPKQMAYDDPGRRWHRSLHDLYVFMRSTGQNGGIVALTAPWDSSTKRGYIEELDRIRDVLGEWRDLLEDQLAND